MSAPSAASKDLHRPARALIAGCGYTGRALGERLLAAGYDVSGMSRAVRDFPPGLKPLAADVSRPSSLATLPNAFELVVYAVAAKESTDEAYRRAYVEGVGNLLAHLDRRVLERFFFVSSTAVYAQEDGSWIDEDSPALPTHFAGRRTLEAESVVRASGVPSTILRCSGIYGPGRERLISAVRHGEPLEVSERYTNRIHRDDVAGAIAFLIEQRAREPLLLLSDDEPTTQRPIIEHIAAQLGVAAPPLRTVAPAPGARGGHKRCSNRRLRATGYRLLYPTFREGYTALIG